MANGLKKTLGLFDATSIVAGSMVGSGIFIVSADIARNLGSPGWLLLVWTIAGLLTVFAALSFGELAGMLPHAGGLYVYLREAYGPLFGFLYGWTLFLVIQPGTIAAISMAFAKYLAVVIPALGKPAPFAPGAAGDWTIVVAILSIVVLTWINSLGVKEGKRVQNIFTVTKFAILGVFIVLGVLAIILRGNLPTFDGFWRASVFSGGLWQPLTGGNVLPVLAYSMVGALFAMDAWYNITFTSAEVRGPRRNLPLSLFLGTLSVSVLYLGINLVYILCLPAQGIPDGADDVARGIAFAGADRVATASMNALLGRSAEFWMALVVVISTFGCNNGIILSGARVFYAMALDGLFFRRTGQLNRKGVPAMALLAQSAWGIALCFSGTYSQLLDYVIFASLLFSVLVIVAVFVLRIRRPHVPRPVPAWGYPVLPAVFVLAGTGILLSLLIYKPEYTWPGLLIVLSGIPVYFVWKRIYGR